MLDGRHTGTGGGNHVTLGGATPADSPLLRRPDLLRSLITYWQNHPSLSYLFSGMFIGPTSQAPRVDEARDDRLYELEIAFQQMEQQAASRARRRRSRGSSTGCCATCWSTSPATRIAPSSRSTSCTRRTAPTGRLGLLEFRAFEMPPHCADERACRCCCCARWSRASGASPTAASWIPWGTRCTTAGCCRTSSRPTCATWSHDLDARRLPVRARVVRAVRRVPLPALRHGELRRHHASSCARRSSRGTCWARR